MESHTGYARFPVPLESLYITKRLELALFDRGAGCWTNDESAEPSFFRFCRTNLPEGPYSCLQYAVDGTRHTFNEVIANQSEFPAYLNIHEYYAFASLRSGVSLQWPNILLNLAAPNLTLNCEEVATLIIQAPLQAGPSLRDKELRLAHDHFTQPSFVKPLLSNIIGKVNSIQANWNEDHSMAILVILLQRIWSLTPVDAVHVQCMKVLFQMRDITIFWAREMVEKLSDATDKDRISTLRHRILSVATTCRLTYDVESENIAHTLEDSHHLSILLEASVYAHDSMPSDIEKLPFDLRRRIWRDRRLSHHLESDIRNAVGSDPAGLNIAVQRIWHGFPSGG